MDGSILLVLDTLTSSYLRSTFVRKYYLRRYFRGTFEGTFVLRITKADLVPWFYLRIISCESTTTVLYFVLSKVLSYFRTCTCTSTCTHRYRYESTFYRRRIWYFRKYHKLTMG